MNKETNVEITYIINDPNNGFESLHRLTWEVEGIDKIIKKAGYGKDFSLTHSNET